MKLTEQRLRKIIKEELVKEAKTGWDEYEQLKDILGPEKLLEDLAQALSGHELLDNMQWIAKQYDIEL